MRRLVLIEGMPRYEGINEAEALAEALSIMMKAYDERTTRSLEISTYTATDKEDFLRSLERDADFLHISSHGEIRRGCTILEIRRGGRVTPDDVRDLRVKAKVVFVNACRGLRKDLREAFLYGKRSKARYCVGPRVDVRFDEAFLAALLFYRRTFLEKRKSLINGLHYIYNLPDIRTNYWLFEK